jgi:hypothetical protein
MDKNIDKNLAVNKTRFDFLPLVIVITYLFVSYMLHLLTNNSNSVALFVFLTTTNLFIAIGYILASNRRQLNVYSKLSGINMWEYNNKIKMLIIISMIITILSSINNISAFYYGTDELLRFIRNPGQAYEYVKFLRNHPEYNTTGRSFGSFVSIFLTLASASKYLYLTLTLIYWKKIKTGVRFLFVLTSIIYLIQSLLIGAMITVASLFMSTVPLLINNLRLRRISKRVNYKEMRKKRISALTFSVVSVLLIVFFIGNRVDDNSSFLEGFRTLAFYLTHGYVGLEKAIYLPFEFTFGFTTFRGITSYLVDSMGINDPFVNSYLIRNEYANGWPSMSLWSTIYPWLASDFSYFGIPFIMGFVSYKFSKVWNRAIVTSNPFGYLLLGQLFIFWFMIPANNQLFQTLGNSAAFISILILYWRSIKYEHKIIRIENLKKSGGDNNV